MTAWKPSPSAQAEVHPTSPATPEPPLPVSNVQDWQPDPWLSAKKEDIKNEEPPLQEAHRESKPDKISPHDNHKARGLYWDEPQPSSRCLAFGTREYTARLWNVPFYAKWVEACEHTEVMIHGIIVPKPSSCESKWPFGGVIGHWIINFGEDDCLARWGKVTDKGCVEPGSKLRRFQSRLWGIKKGEDWMTLCKTAPASIHGISTLKPTTCEDQGLWGVYGVWDLEDGSC
ncbi:hypothetical protein BDZ97DRAFT_145 [Flammula alnicola]|nr:hypothetical protein BDZ97DRAFT_248386 [Flammula alnicola]KAF8974158.1 hypothetical protein BDZ97DRAFT_145 [Flammula alnicola]